MVAAPVLTSSELASNEEDPRLQKGSSSSGSFSSVVFPIGNPR